jgi:hypothetical protein
MRRTILICLALASAALAMLPMVAGSASGQTQGKASTPTITRVTPMRLGIGSLVTIRGRHFKPVRAANTVIFRAPDGRSAFAKPHRASSGRLVVAVPAAAARLVARASSGPKATRFKLRVLSGRFSKFTPRRLSPVIVSAGGGTRSPGGAPGSGGGSTGGGAPRGGGAPSGGGVPSGGGAPISGGGPTGGGAPVGCPGQDYDGDLLSNSDEARLKLDPCLADTDGDSVEDGYEYQSAVDLNYYPNSIPMPYPGQRPYPNPLDPSDGTPSGTDYDGDGLLLREEFLLWKDYSADGVRRGSGPDSLNAMVYSDGLQRSVVVQAPDEVLDPRGNWALDDNDNDWLADDERDADADGLANWDEVRGRMTEAWWPQQHDGKREPKESKYPNIDFLDNGDTAPRFDAHTDPDMDDDGKVDGKDDNDHDGLSNAFEVRRPDNWILVAIPTVEIPNPANPWAYTNPFNPCKPFNSERCHLHPPFGYYDSDAMPPIGPNPPAGYADPATHPDTPEG